MYKNTSVAIDIGNITSIGVSNEKEVVIESRIKELEVGIDDFNPNENFECDGIKYISNSGKFENDLLKFNKENYHPQCYVTVLTCYWSIIINRCSYVLCFSFCWINHCCSCFCS